MGLRNFPLASQEIAPQLPTSANYSAGGVGEIKSLFSCQTLNHALHLQAIRPTYTPFQPDHPVA